MTIAHDPTILPAGIPAPQDDGGARHLTGLRLPAMSLAATDGANVDLSKLAGRSVVYIYPRTGVPGQPLPEGWDEIPGARECALELRSFSKRAGFTGVRCAYLVVPKTVTGIGAGGKRVPLHTLWARRHTTKFNGASYIVQRGAAGEVAALNFFSCALQGCLDCDAALYAVKHGDQRHDAAFTGIFSDGARQGAQLLRIDLEAR